MKYLTIISTLIASFVLFNGWSQKNAISLNNKKVDETQANTLIINDKTFNPQKKVKYYHVEEITTLKFGGHKTVYNVSNPKLIRSYDLGPNNRRIVTPVFEEGIQEEKTTLKSDTLMRIESPSRILISDTPKKVDSNAYIDIIKTYERVYENGFETVDILKKLANYYFFSDEFEKAEKSYFSLFTKTTDLEPEYYYRYSIALKSVGKTEKSNEYLKKFNQLSNNNSR
jgi:tetratricopeptide (TPR) repeat protein